MKEKAFIKKKGYIFTWKKNYYVQAETLFFNGWVNFI